jgi:hypothetical protein
MRGVAEDIANSVDVRGQRRYDKNGRSQMQGVKNCVLYSTDQRSQRAQVNAPDKNLLYRHDGRRNQSSKAPLSSTVYSSSPYLPRSQNPVRQISLFLSVHEPFTVRERIYSVEIQ